MLMRGRFDNAMTFDQWWDKNEMDRVDHADRTSSEEVWQAAQKELLRQQRQRKTKKGKR